MVNWQPEWEKVWSRLSAHLQPFFWLSARILKIFDKKYSGSLWPYVTPTLAPSGSNLLSQAFTGSLWLLLDLSLFLSGSLWLSVTPTLAPSGSNLLT